MLLWFYKPDHRTIDIDSLLSDYEREYNPPPTCWERIKHMFRK